MKNIEKLGPRPNETEIVNWFDQKRFDSARINNVIILMIRPIRERDCENRKARRQTSECKATLVSPREKERRRLRGKNDDGDGGAR